MKLGAFFQRPAAPAKDECPQCKAGPERRGPSAGFGKPHLICLKCGHDFGLMEDANGTR